MRGYNNAREHSWPRLGINGAPSFRKGRYSALLPCIGVFVTHTKREVEREKVHVKIYFTNICKSFLMNIVYFYLGTNVTKSLHALDAFSSLLLQPCQVNFQVDFRPVYTR